MIYLDYNATTPIEQEVIDEMMPYFREYYGNAASRTHLFGWDAREGVDLARKRIASLIGVHPKEIVFTSGATESINLALKGLFDTGQKVGKNHIITVKTEHKAVLDTCLYLQKIRDAHITYLDVNDKGHIDLNQLRDAITDKTLLVSIMYANNETGLLHPIEEIGTITREKNVRLFSDATQAISKIDVQPRKLGIDLMAFSSHKIYGPKGIGALYVRKGIEIQEQQNGGGHERKRRSGTLNVPGIVGFGKAAAIAQQHWKTDSEKLEKLRNYLEANLQQNLENITINGDIANRMPNVSNVHFEHVESEQLMLALSTHVALSAGSACNSASVLPSHVLKAMGLSDEGALSSIRFSLGRPTTQKEIDIVIRKIIEAVNRLRGENY